jgi:hypothetical protein
LVGVFDGWGFAFFVELLRGLSVLIGLVVLIWRRSGLLRRILLRRVLLLRRIGLLRGVLLLRGILLVTLLGLGLIANSKYRSLSCGGGSRTRLAGGNRGQVGVCRIRTGVISRLCGVQVAVASCGSGER